MIYTTTMKKKILTISLGIIAYLPFYSYAEEFPSLPIATSTKITVAENSSTSTMSETPTWSLTLCSQEAIETRDTSIASSRAIYNTAMTNALTERKNKEKISVAAKNEDLRKETLKLSVEAYKHQTKAAQTTLTLARKVAWQTFDTTIQKCRSLDEAMNAENSTYTNSPTDKKIESRAVKNEILEPKVDEVKSFRDTLKTQIENFKSLFN